MSSIRDYLKKSFDTLISKDLSAMSAHFDSLTELFPQNHSSHQILRKAVAKEKFTVTEIPELRHIIRHDSRDLVLLDGVFNHYGDIQGLLVEMRQVLKRGSRLFIIAYNPYLRWLYQMANLLGLRKGELPSVFLTKADLSNLARLSGYSVVRIKGGFYFPFEFFGIGNVLNGLLSLIPLIKDLSLVQTIVLRPKIPSNGDLSLSVIIPARNEKGNIENAVKRLDNWQRGKLEIIFIEGHSTDGTWEEILRVKDLYQNRFVIKAARQPGEGKNDAVRTGFDLATGELLTILDADLTMPPELLNRFYDAYQAGIADFVNGNRLMYPAEEDAMRFLNRLGNIFFAKALSFVLNVRISDSLCGTKLLSMKDYQRFKKWREEFGDFDPFGDFELLFPAALLGLEIVDIPVPYRSRTYGFTNIKRFNHGWLLLKMTLIGLLKVNLNLLNSKASCS